MKKFSALLLVLAFAAQTFSQGIVVLNFYINQASIAKKSCENRFRPMLHCNGKCVLAKKIKEQEKKERQQPELKLSGKVEVFSSRSFFTASTYPVQTASKSFPAICQSLAGGQPRAVFHPPGR